MSVSNSLARSVVAGVVSAVLVFTVVTPVNAKPLAVADEVFEPGIVPLVESPAVEVSDSIIPEGDFSDLAESASATDGEQVAGAELTTSEAPALATVPSGQINGAANLPGAEVLERSEFETVYANPEGGRRTVISNTAINAENDEGAWVPVDPHLTVEADGSWSADAHPLDPTFADTTGDGVYEVSRDGYDVSFSLLGADTAWADRWGLPWSNTGDQVSYDDVFDGVDLDFDVEKSGIKETLVLRELPSREDASWTWLIDSDGLDLRLDEFGNIEFVDRRGEVQFHIPAPIMWDSSGVTGQSEDEIANVRTTLHETDEGWELKLVPSYAWLSDADRVYPVSIDPTMYGGEAGRVAYKQDGATRTDSVQVGNATAGQWKNWRTVVAYPYSSAFGYQVTNAWLSIYHGNQGFLGAASGSIHWANCYGFNCLGEYLGGYTVSTGTVGGGGTAMINRYAQLVRDNAAGMALIITGQEGTAYTNKQLSTTLVIDTLSYPVLTGYTATSPANGATHVTSTPILEATGSQAEGRPLSYAYRIGTTSNVDASLVYTSETAGWTAFGASSAVQVPQLANLLPNTTYYWKGCVKDDYDGYAGTSTIRCGAVRSFTTNTPAPTATQSATAPADGSVVTTLTPTLTSNTVTDVNGDPVQYGFRIATGADGKTGTIIDSGWQSSPTWIVPPGVLQDGGSYTWVALTSDGIDTKISPPWTNKLKVNMRLGTSGPSPYDTVGPVTVNLANGNASLGFASPTVNTLGGPMGLSFSYNSQQPADVTRGLTGSYYDALNVGQTSTTTFDVGTRTPLLVRTDPQVSFQWAAGSPGPAVPSDYFLARWTGFIKVPTGGSYTFGVVRDDGARVVINDTTTVIDHWTTGSVPLTWGTPITMTTNQTAIRVDAYDSTGSAALELWVKGPGLPAEGQIVPANWLSTKVQPLPAGWTSSTPIAGAASAYASAKVTEGAVVLTDMSGTAHTYTKTSTGGYTAPVGEYGVLSLDTIGQVVLTEADGTVYTFTGKGSVASVTTAADALKPATPILSYRANGLVDRISDPVSLNAGSNPATYSREVRFVYKGDSECVVPSGYVVPPDGMLCRIIYPGAVTTSPDNTTRLGYDSNGQLAAVIDPGVEQTTFGYDGNGRLAWVRDSLANDWLIATATSPTNMNSTTQIAYTAGGRVASVTLPAPDGLTATQRPAKTFTYDSDGVHTYVDVAGLNTSGATATGGHASAITYDAAWRQITATSSMGLTSSRTWSVKDQVLSATDAYGLTSTTIYDSQDRPTDTYGPAPTSCYALDANGTPRAPSGPCAIAPAHTSTAYDAGLQGLHAAWYNNIQMAGRPVTFGLGIEGVASGIVDKDWGTGAPATGVSIDNFSARFTGTITFQSTGNYVLKTLGDDGTRVWLDDLLVLDHWVDGAPTTASSISIPVQAGETRRIRLEAYQKSNAAQLRLQWSLDGATAVAIPGSQLKPDYGLANGVTVEDSAPAGSGLSDTQVPDMVTSLGYTHPWLGAVTSSTIDPGGLNLTTSTTYEAPSTTANSWLRRLTRTMPSGGSATTTTAYYTDSEALVSATCGVPAGTKQYGFAKTTTTAASASGPGIVTENVYDLFGRAVGTKRSGDATWSCVTYDARGRVASSALSAYGTTAARTVNNTYAVGGDPLVSTVVDSSMPSGTLPLRSQIDLLGRAVSSTDVWGTLTTPAYEPLTGRVMSVTTSPPLASDADMVQSFTYDLDGKVETVSLDGDVIADPAYASTQLLDSVAYLNDTTLSGITRNQAGAGTGMTWTFPDHPAVAGSVEAAPTTVHEFDPRGGYYAEGDDTELIWDGWGPGGSSAGSMLLYNSNNTVARDC